MPSSSRRSVAELHVRRAEAFDAGGLAALLTDMGAAPPAGPLTAAELRGWMAAPGSVWHVAETAGEVLGVQWIEPGPAVPAGEMSIATFAKAGRHGLGIGAALWSATRDAARAMGVRAIRAVIAPNNEGGRAFYRSRGFERVADAPDGRVVKLFRL
jgi:ribosomal protein S18 acetylase RimI-like enzyme